MDTDMNQFERPDEAILAQGRELLRSWLGQAERDARGLLADADALKDSIDGILAGFAAQGEMTWSHLDALVIAAPDGAAPHATLYLRGQPQGAPDGIRWPGSAPGTPPGQMAYEVLVFAALKILIDQAAVAAGRDGRHVVPFRYGSLEIEVPARAVADALQIAGGENLVEAQREHMARGVIDQVCQDLRGPEGLAAWMALSEEGRQTLYIKLAVLLALGVKAIDAVEAVAA